MFRRELWPGAAQELNNRWVDAIDSIPRIIWGHPSFSPYGDKEPIWFMQDPSSDWRQYEWARMCFECGRKATEFERSCSGTQIHENRLALRRRYEKERLHGTLGLKPLFFNRRRKN